MRTTERAYFTFKPGGAADTSTYGVWLSNKYTAIAPNLGLTPVADPASTDATHTTVGDATAAGLLIKLRINMAMGNGRRGATDIVCNPSNIATALKGLPQKEYGTGQRITSVKGRPRQDFR